MSVSTALLVVPCDAPWNRWGPYYAALQLLAGCLVSFFLSQTMQRIPAGGLRRGSVMPLRMRMEWSLHRMGVPDRLARMLTWPLRFQTISGGKF